MMWARNFIDWFIFFALAILMAALPLSKYFMSAAQLALASAFIVDGIKLSDVQQFYGRSWPYKIAMIIPQVLAWIVGSLIRKFTQFFRKENMPAIVFSSLFLLHAIGLLYTTDFDYAIKDLRIKFPIFVLPLILSTTVNIDRKKFNWLMWIFTAAVLAGTFISTKLLIDGNYDDIRKVSIFISHIRFGLLISIAIFTMLYYVLAKGEISFTLKIVFSAIIIWLLVFMVMASFITGLAVFLGTSLILLVIMVLNKNKNVWVRSGFLIGLLILPIILVIYLTSIYKDVNRLHPVDVNTLEKTTPEGNNYWHDLESTEIENGYLVWIYVAPDEELAENWAKRSTIDYYGKDHKGQEIKYTLIRFLTSKGFRKDASGISKLSDDEVKHIENGVASTVYCEKPGLYVRMYKIFWEYQQYKVKLDASGHSVVQRFEYWQAASSIIKDNWLIGVGTGDMDLAFDEQYQKMKTSLQDQFRWRSHNQYMAIMVAFGVIGLIWFLISMIYPPVKLRKFSDFFFLSFFIIICLSMIWEDTIETQAGVTIYAYFFSFYLFSKKFNNTL